MLNSSVLKNNNYSHGDRIQRIESLDYLRRIMAISVMLYHYYSWSFGTLGVETLLGKLGIYAVSIFYVLSGLSLTIVYYQRIKTISDISRFFIKRLFRIFPLFWLVITVSLLYRYIAGSGELDVSLYIIFLNYSLLFSFFDPTAYLSTGAWSIGNEVVFYSVLVLAFFLSNKNIIVLSCIILLSFIIGFYISNELLNSHQLLSKQWNTYINPLNQFYLFMSGVVIGRIHNKIKVIPSLYAWLFIGAIFLLFCFFPVEGDSALIVAGFERWYFSILSILLVFILYLWNPKLASWRHKIFSFFGQASCSIYLLHPLVAIPVISIFNKIGFDKSSGYILPFFLVFAVSWVTFKYIELPLMRYSKNI